VRRLSKNGCRGEEEIATVEEVVVVEEVAAVEEDAAVEGKSKSKECECDVGVRDEGSQAGVDDEYESGIGVAPPVKIGAGIEVDCALFSARLLKMLLEGCL